MNEMCPLDSHEDEMGRIKNEAADAVMCRRYFLWVYWTRKSPEGLKMNNDETHGFIRLRIERHLFLPYAPKIDEVFGL